MNTEQSLEEMISESEKKTMTREDLLKAKEILKLQSQNGNWNHNEYMFGMYNGMEYIVSLMENREPQFKEKPNMWLKDKNNST